MQVPTDSELLLAALKMERRAKLAIPQLPSTFSADVAAITGAIPQDQAPKMPSVGVPFAHTSCQSRVCLGHFQTQALCILSFRAQL